MPTTPRVVVDGPHRIRLENGVLPDQPPPGAVRIAPIAIGICGSDLHVLAGHHPFVNYPVYPGHELVGRVVALGDGAPRELAGATVILEPGLACGHCRCCRRGDRHLCESLRVMGFQAAGGMAALVDVPADRLHPLPDHVPAEHGALVEPLAVATHAARLAGHLEGRDVLVFGAGTIGLLVALTVTTIGATVTVVDPSEQRRAVALERFGLVASDAPANLTCDVAFECVGAEGALRDAVASLRKGGTALIVGVHGHDARLQVGWIQDRELVVRGTLMYQRDDVTEALRLIADGHVNAAPFIDARFSLTDVERAYAAAREGGRTLKVLLHP